MAGLKPLRRLTADRLSRLGGPPRRLALALAAVVLLVAAPAWADYKSAVSAYEAGDYGAAYREFTSLVGQGDGRAQRYLDRLSEKGYGAGGTSSGSSSSSSSGGSPIDFWSRDRSGGASAGSGVSGLVTPSHRSIWAKLFFIPSDATMIGLQLMARTVGAGELELDLRHASRDGNVIVFGLFALFWWFVIFKLIMAIGQAVVRVTRDTLPTSDRDY